MMLFINRQYSRSARELAVKPDLVVREPHREERVVVPIPGINRAVIQAINVGRSIDDDVRAVYISEDPDDAAAVRAQFERQIPGIPLVVVESPYRALAGPLLAYLDVLDGAWPPDKPHPITFIIIPEYVAAVVVGAHPLQPVGEAPPGHPPRPTAHGRRQRAVPARGGDRASPDRDRPRRTSRRPDVHRFCAASRHRRHADVMRGAPSKRGRGVCWVTMSAEVTFGCCDNWPSQTLRVARSRRRR